MSDIFVFGSNLAGRHGKGAAKAALQLHGAIYGQGIGPQGNSYAIPTKDKNMKTLSLYDINIYIRDFMDYVYHNQDLTFNITRIGCGLAGYTESDIIPLFDARLKWYKTTHNHIFTNIKWNWTTI